MGHCSDSAERNVPFPFCIKIPACVTLCVTETLISVTSLKSACWGVPKAALSLFEEKACLVYDIHPCLPSSPCNDQFRRVSLVTQLEQKHDLWSAVLRRAPFKSSEWARLPDLGKSFFQPPKSLEWVNSNSRLSNSVPTWTITQLPGTLLSTCVFGC